MVDLNCMSALQALQEMTKKKGGAAKKSEGIVEDVEVRTFKTKNLHNYEV